MGTLNSNAAILKQGCWVSTVSRLSGTLGISAITQVGATCLLPIHPKVKLVFGQDR
jgi:hypothetical protein